MRKRIITSIFTCILAGGAFAQDAKMDAFISDLMSKMTLEEKIGQLNLSNNRMYVTAANTGNHDGGEDMLKAGETKTVKFTLTQNDLKYYDHDLNYVCEPGEFKIMVGPNSRDVESISIQAL